MNELTVTAKGQVTLRKELLTHLGVQPGEKIAVHKLPDGGIPDVGLHGPPAGFRMCSEFSGGRTAVPCRSSKLMK